MIPQVPRLRLRGAAELHWSTFTWLSLIHRSKVRNCTASYSRHSNIRGTYLSDSDWTFARAIAIGRSLKFSKIQHVMQKYPEAYRCQCESYFDRIHRLLLRSPRQMSKRYGPYPRIPAEPLLPYLDWYLLYPNEAAWRIQQKSMQVWRYDMRFRTSILARYRGFHSIGSLGSLVHLGSTLSKYPSFTPLSYVFNTHLSLHALGVAHPPAGSS